MGPWIYPVYFVDLIAMVMLSFFLGNLVDLLDKKTKISGAFIGGVLLAAVTSLPELFTAFSSVVLVRSPELVVGDILGSVIFDLVCLVLETFLFIKHFKDAKLQAWHWINGILLLGMYALAAYAFFAPSNCQVMLGDINLMSVLILAIYVCSLIFQPKESEKEDVLDNSADDKKKEMGADWDVKKVVFFFIISAILLIGTSIFLTYLTDWIKESIPALSGSAAGALLLGVGTSIPEIVSTAQLFRKKNYDAGYGNMIGSCTFDMAILAFTDFFSWHQMVDPSRTEITNRISTHGIYILDADTFKFVIFGLVSLFATIGLVLLQRKTKIFTEKKKLGFALAGLLAVICLGAYLVTFLVPLNPIQ